MSEYRVNLDIYNGPLDLLLYLIRREEVDIYDIPIARIAEQYLAYVEMIQTLDPNLAGDFLVLAATLIEIKTRMLLPAAQAEDGEEAGEAFDPRAELVRQLLEYKAFKDAAAELGDAADARRRRHARRPPEPDLPEEPDKDLEDVQVWDLFEAFANLLSSIGADKPHHEVIYDDTPVATYCEDVLDRLTVEGPLSFSALFEGKATRSEIVGVFLALLELARQKWILCFQDVNFRDIRIQRNPAPPQEAPERTVEHPEGPEG